MFLVPTWTIMFWKEPKCWLETCLSMDSRVPHGVAWTVKRCGNIFEILVPCESESISVFPGTTVWCKSINKIPWKLKTGSTDVPRPQKGSLVLWRSVLVHVRWSSAMKEGFVFFMCKRSKITYMRVSFQSWLSNFLVTFLASDGFSAQVTAGTRSNVSWKIALLTWYACSTLGKLKRPAGVSTTE